MTSLLEKSRSSSLWVAPAQAVIQAVGMAATIILARSLSVEDYGVYNLFVGALLIFGFLTNLGLAGSLQRFLPEYARLGRHGSFLKTFFFSIGYRTIAGLAVFAAAILLFDRFALFFKVGDYRGEFILFSAGAYLLFQTDFLTVALNSLFLHRYAALAQTFYMALRCALIAVALFALRGGLAGVFAGELIAYGVGALLFWGFFLRKAVHPWRHEAREGGIEWRRLFRFSGYNAATIPGNILFSNAMDYFVVAAMASTSQLGIYALGSRASKMLLAVMPQSVLQTVIRPAFYHQYCSAADKEAELGRMFRSLVKVIALFLFPALALTAICAEPLLTFVFKAKFAGSTPVFLMFLGFSVFSIFDLPGDLVLQATEKLQARFFAQMFAVYNLAAAVLLMPRYGVLGVAFATGSALMGKCLFFFVMARRYAGVSVGWGALGRIALNTAAAAAASLALGRLGQGPGWMFGSLAAGVAVYLGVSLINNPLDDDERKMVNRLARRQLFVTGQAGGAR